MGRGPELSARRRSADGSHRETFGSRRDLRVEMRRRSILSAAAECFAEYGYDQVTLEQVGAAVGLSGTALYHYVGGKEDLLSQLLLEAVASIEEEAQDAVQTAADPADSIRAFLHAQLHVIVTTPAGRVLVTHLDTVLAPTSDSVLREARRRHEKTLERFVAAGIEEGRFRVADPKSVVRVMLGALHGVARWQSRRPDSVSTAAAAEELADLLFGGLLAPTSDDKGNINGALGTAETPDLEVM